MSLRLQDPLWLLVIAGALPLAVLGLLWFNSMTRLRRWVCITLRVLMFTALAAAFAGATLIREVDRLAVIAIVDISGSVQRLFDPGVDPTGQPVSLHDRVSTFLEAASTPDGGPARRADDLSAVIVYDSTASVIGAVETRTPAPFLPRPITADAGSTSDGTNTASALRLARALAPPDAATRFILFWDGNDTAGDALSVAQSLHRDGGRASSPAPATAAAPPGPRSTQAIAIDTVPLRYLVNAEVSVESVEAPSAAPAESTIQVRVTLMASAPTRGELRLSREGEPVDASPDEPGLARRLDLPAGRTSIRIPVRLPAGRVHRFEAIFTPDQPGDDRIAENNRAQSVTLSPGRSSVLVIDGVTGGESDTSGGGTMLARTLSGAGLQVESLAPSAIRADPLWLQRYDLVLLQNVPADALDQGVSDALATYVTDQGGGLVMVGGPDSFGAGGWKGTPIEPILPVLLDLPERLISPAAAVVIVIDRSGSMRFRTGSPGGGPRRTKQDIANDGAAIAVKSLDKTDLVGLITFSNNYEVLIPLGPNRDAESSGALIRSIRPDGGTNLPPALEAAHRQLRDAKAEVKHIIVLSDGRSQNTDELPGIAAAARADGIRISTIAVGDEADGQTMALIAARGEGTYYRVIDPNLLPRIFLKAVRVVRSPSIRETPFQPVMLATGSPLIEGLGTPPLLNGLVLTQARSEPTVTYAMATPTGEPLLAHWNAGVGRVAAFTSDAHRWAAPWVEDGAAWDGYPRMWMQIVRTIARPQADRGQELFVDLDGDDLVVRLIARDAEGESLDGLAIDGTVHAPGGRRIPLRLAQVGAGEYVARSPSPDVGSSVATLVPRLDGRPLPPIVGGVARSGGAEFRRLSSDTEALARISEATGGRVLDLDRPAEARLFDRSGVQPAVARQPLWRWLIIAGLGLFLLDTASRRVAWDRFFGREYGARAARRRAAAADSQRSSRAAATVERLRRRDESLAETASTAPGPAKLSADDARAIVQAESDRRRQARASARAATNDAVAPERSRDPGSSAPAPPDSPPAAGTSGLLEAKRRARRQLDGEEPKESP